MKKQIAIGIKQADGSIIPLPEIGVLNSFAIDLTPAHIRQRKIKLTFLSMSGDGGNKQAIGHVSIRINRNTIQDDGSLKLHCEYIKNRVCISLVDAHEEEIPLAMFKNSGISKAGVVFRIVAGLAWSAVIAVLILYVAEKTIPSFSVFESLGLKLPF